ncbi:hypothetical protein ACLOAV_009663 [Pseudogymnoascus australis]
MAEVSAAAFMNEELHGELMHPYRKEYPEDFILFFERKLLSHWYDPKHHFLVGLDKLSGKVIAVAMWERQGASTDSFTSWSNYLNYTTHPDFQGQGIGKELVKWGIDEADKENVCASVISSDGNEGFYGQSGFIEVGRANVGRLKENGIKGGAIMFRDTDKSRRAIAAAIDHNNSGAFTPSDESHLMDAPQCA